MASIIAEKSFRLLDTLVNIFLISVTLFSRDSLLEYFVISQEHALLISPEPLVEALLVASVYLFIARLTNLVMLVLVVRTLSNNFQVSIPHIFLLVCEIGGGFFPLVSSFLRFANNWILF